MRHRHFFHRIFLIILGLSLLLIGSWLPFAGHVPAAFASSFVIGSDPIDGSTVSVLPATVRIYFNAPVSSLSRANVYAFPPNGPANGEQVNAGPGGINAHNSRELDAPLLAANKLPQGSYEVRWTAISLTDGRSTSGLIGFNLGQSSVGLAGSPTLGPSTSNNFPRLDLQGILSVAWDWLVLLALLFWVGILVTDLFIIPRSTPESLRVQVRQHSRSLQAFCLAALLVGEVVNLILRSTSTTQMLGGGGIDPDALTRLILQTDYGHFWIARMGLLVFASLFLWWTSYRPHPREKSSTPTHRSGNTRLGQLRQQARPEVTSTLPVVPRSAPPPARSQARVTGAVATNVSYVRGNTASLPRINGNVEPVEASMQTSSTWSIVTWLTLAGLIMLTFTLSNELTQLSPLPASTEVFLWLVVAAQAFWFGSAAYLGITLFPILPAIDPDHHADILVNTLKRATPLLLSSIGILLVGTLFLDEATLQTPSQLLDTPYGQAMLVQALLFLFALLFTGYILFFLLPRLQRQTVLLPVVNAELPARRTRKFALEKTASAIRSTLHVLAGLAATALICTALMNFFAPPVAFPDINYASLVNQSSSTNASSSTAQQKQAGDITVTLQVLPARVGVANTLVLFLSDAQGKPVTDAEVKVHVNMEVMDMGVVTANAQESNTVYVAEFSAQQTFTMAGSWTVQVEIDRSGQQPVQLSFQVIATQ